ncbi:MAG: hypothetical protein WCL61_03155 [bacterium]
MFTNYLLAIIGVGVFGLVVIIFRHLSDLRNLDLTTISEEQQRQAKAKIIKTKLNRQGDKIKGKLSDFLCLNPKLWQEGLIDLKKKPLRWKRNIIVI